MNTNSSMLKYKLLALCVFIGTYTSIAVTLTPKEALDKFKQTYSKEKALINSYDGLKLSYRYSSEGKKSYYFYNKEGENGFIILSSDSCENALIGYSQTGTINQKNIPEALKFLLKEHHATTEHIYGKQRKAISPMLTTRWNQNEPYNNTLPTPYGDKSVAGCVTTAMAQVINYHRFPVQPTGSIEYTSVLNHYSADLTKYNFDFDNMIADYKEDNPTDKQIKAVNDLFYCCGMSVESSWGKEVTTAQSSLIPERMNKHFGYSSAMGIVNRSSFTSDEWSDLVYNQLEKGMPVMISAKSGNNSSIGHLFICDGCDENGYYHINWGWGGALDGFFNLNSLYSYDPDIDFSTEGFSINQKTIINICPENLMKSPVEIFTADSFSLPAVSFDLGKQIEVSCALKQCTGYKTPVKFGLKFTEINTGKSIISVRDKTNELERDIITWSWWQSLPKELEEGTYKVSPIIYVCEDNAWQDIHIDTKANRYYMADVVGSKITFYKPTNKGILTIKKSTYPETLFYNKTFSAYADLINDSENDFSGYIALCICTEKEDGTYRVIDNSPTTYIHMKPGEINSVFLSGKFTYSSAIRDYYIVFMHFPNGDSYNCKPLGELKPISVKEYIEGSLIIDEVNVIKESEPSNPTMTINAMFRCEDGYYNGEIFMDFVECDENGELLESTEEDDFNNAQFLGIIQSMNTNSSSDTFSKEPKSPIVTIGRVPHPVKISANVKGKGREYNPSANIPKPKRWYRPRYYYKSSSNDDFLYLLASLIIGVWAWDTLDIQSIDMDGGNSNECTYYNINGTKLSTKPSSPGIYIKFINDGKSMKAEKILLSNKAN